MSPDFGTASLKMFGALILVLGLIMFLLFLVKKLRINPANSGGIPVMRILRTLNLAPKRAIALIEVCDQWLLIGIGTENITLISRIDQIRGTESFDAGGNKGGGFHGLLQDAGFHQSGQMPGGTGNND